MRHPTVLAQVAILEVELGLAVHDLPRRLEGTLAVARVNQFDHRPTDQLLGGITKNAFAGGTDKYETPLAVDGTHGVQQKVYVAGQRRGISSIHGAGSHPENAAVDELGDRTYTHDKTENSAGNQVTREIDCNRPSIC